jgi:hypothetical protein
MNCELKDEAWESLVDNLLTWDLYDKILDLCMHFFWQMYIMNN